MAAWWANGRFLPERAAGGQDPGDAPSSRRARWEEGLPEPLLTRYLEDLGVPRDAFAAALGAQTDPGPAPAWALRVEAALAVGVQDADVEAHDPALGPVVAWARRIADAFLRTAGPGAGSPEPELARALLRSVRDALASCWRRPLELDLEVTRLLEAWPAQEADARGWQALDRLREPGALRVLVEANPGAARATAEQLDAALAAHLRVVEHLQADRPVLARLFGVPLTAPVEEARALGDPHDGGRQVLRVRFAGGHEVMYKPRRLVTDLAYGRLTAALEEAGFRPAFTAPAVVDAGQDHGWQAVARPASCTSRDEVERYFRRLGAHLALLHALRATDMHAENIMACGEQPVFIDLETLLQPRMGAASAPSYDSLLGECSVHSVLRVGVLPRPDGPLGVDIAGIGRDVGADAVASDGTWGGRLSPQAAARWEQHGDNVARLDGEPVRFWEWADTLAAGFADAYRLLLAHREEWLAPAGPLTAIGEGEMRFLLRGTQVYVFLLRALRRGDAVIADALTQEEVLHRLWRSGLQRADLAAAAAGERHDLLHGDVPRVTSRPGTRDLHHHATGLLRGALGSQESPAPGVVRELSEDDLDRQLAIIHAAVRASPGLGVARQPLAVTSPAASSGAKGSLLAGGERLAARLGTRALRDEAGRAGWLALRTRRPPRAGAVLAPTGPDLHDGQAGVVLFLDELGRALGRRLSLAAPAHARLDAMVAANVVPAAHRAGLVLAGALPNDWTEPDRSDVGPLALAGRVLVSSVLGGDAGLPAAARRLVAEGHGAGPLEARALAAAAVALGDPELTSTGAAMLERLARPAEARASSPDVAADRPLGSAGTPACTPVAAVASERDPALALLAWSALAEAPRGDRGLVRARIASLVDQLEETASSARLLDVAALARAARLLASGHLDATARAAAGRLLAAPPADAPGLRDGLAGVGIAVLLAAGHGGHGEVALMLAALTPRTIEDEVQLVGSAG